MRVEYLLQVHSRIGTCTFCGYVARAMQETPLRKFLDERRLTAEHFAVEHGFSPWSVRHWTRGNKFPALASQVEIERATAGSVAPSDWLAWMLLKSGVGR